MALDIQWDHQFCLACDKQTDGATYCSESCRLADYEKTSSAASSGASSPALSGPHHAWGFSSTTSSSHASGLYLSPALDFLSQSSSTRSRQQTSASFSTRPLSPSSSHSSLSSMGSSNAAAARTSNEAHQLSEKARRELQAYASTFEQVRLQRRRSY
ncbi:hypothetical protein MAPG_09703 [Magnaporthiopsis poae ATCC 64411]|uniref:Life-span regulatory factor domain-containing protein n=1 Tax=Magnaporthiopsis poae (strain ATCC 64411 / 73-15) TaxID=644358 RepID=A0A0C4EAM8_MAGP6|nr:hypothetical protein MAPG_09703 [Magnaporthiopsis poae ATCC 64411]